MHIDDEPGSIIFGEVYFNKWDNGRSPDNFYSRR